MLRYGENPHQRAALYVTPASARSGLAQADQLHGKEMSYNNYVDGDAAWRAAYDFAEPCVAIIKHANPCGIAVGADIADAHRKAHACDPVSAYGGVIATNRPVTRGDGRAASRTIFTEVVVAPAFDDGRARDAGPRRRTCALLVAAPRPDHAGVETAPGLRRAAAADRRRHRRTGRRPGRLDAGRGPAADAATLADLGFAWRAVRAVKSNAILLASDGATVGVGMGQVNRVDSCRLAVERAGERAAGSVAASDAFFPFADGPGCSSTAGVRAIVAAGRVDPRRRHDRGGRAAGVTLYFTGTRHFAH